MVYKTLHTSNHPPPPPGGQRGPWEKGGSWRLNWFAHWNLWDANEWGGGDGGGTDDGTHPASIVGKTFQYFANGRGQIWVPAGVLGGGGGGVEEDREPI